MGQYLFRSQSASPKKTVTIIAEPIAIHRIQTPEPIQLEEPQTEQPVFGIQESFGVQEPLQESIGVQEPLQKPTDVTDATSAIEESKEDPTTPLIAIS